MKRDESGTAAKMHGMYATMFSYNGVVQNLENLLRRHQATSSGR